MKLQKLRNKKSSFTPWTREVRIKEPVGVRELAREGERGKAEFLSLDCTRIVILPVPVVSAKSALVHHSQWTWVEILLTRQKCPKDRSTHDDDDEQEKQFRPCIPILRLVKHRWINYSTLE